MKTLFAMLIIALMLLSCSNPPISTNGAISDTISQEYNPKILKSMGAINVDSLSNLKYSIDFDNIYNKKFFLTRFRVVDIQDGLIKIRPHGVLNNYLFVLSIDSIKDVQGFESNKYGILLNINAVRKLDYQLNASLNTVGDDDTKSEPTADIELSNSRKRFVVYGDLDSLVLLKQSRL